VISEDGMSDGFLISISSVLPASILLACRRISGHYFRDDLARRKIHFKYGIEGKLDVRGVGALDLSAFWHAVPLSHVRFVIPKGVNGAPKARDSLTPFEMTFK
jgi:hypothetical protein